MIMQTNHLNVCRKINSYEYVTIMWKLPTTRFISTWWTENYFTCLDSTETQTLWISIQAQIPQGTKLFPCVVREGTPYSKGREQNKRHAIGEQMSLQDVVISETMHSFARNY